MAIRFRTKNPIPPTAICRHGLDLYTDGSLRGWGWVLALPGAAEPLEGRSGVAPPGPTTSNRMELEGILRGLERVHTDPNCYPSKLTVRSDSKYAIGVADGGHKAVANLDLVDAIQSTVSELRGLGIRVSFQHCKAHSGIPGNELADQLAGLWRC